MTAEYRYPLVTNPAKTLADLYLEPPMSVINRRGRRWRARQKYWQQTGIQSGDGRPTGLLGDYGPLGRILTGNTTGYTSIFDPALAELITAWWSREGDVILDPFAGGSVRGVVASAMGRRYLGVDLSQQQVDANRRQAGIGSPDMPPQWICGDSADLDTLLDDATEADLMLTCPPYGNLERYSDNPADLSTMDWPTFTDTYRQIISATIRRLRRDRFAAIVISDIKDNQGGYRGLPDLTAQALRDTGCRIVTEAVILDPLGTKPVLCEKPFRTNRTITRVHQNLIVAVKGDRHAATDRLEFPKHPALADPYWSNQEWRTA